MSAILWDFTRYRIIAYYRRFGTTNHSHLKVQAVQKENLALLDPRHGTEVIPKRR